MNERNLEINFLDITREAKEFWSNLFSKDFDRVSFYADYQRTGDECEFKKSSFHIADDIHAKLDKLAKGNDLSLYILLLSVVNIQLFKYTSQSNLMVGIPVYFKNQKSETANQVLPFINTIDETMTFKDVLINNKDLLIQAYKHQIYPLSELLKEKDIEEIRAILPVNILMKSFHNDRDIEYISNSNKSEVIFSIEKCTDSIRVETIYNSKLFRDDTISRLHNSFLCILKHVTNDIQVPISEIQLISEEEKHKILAEFNATGAQYPADKTIQELFEEQVEKTPDNIAVVYQNKKVTYRELNEKANSLAKVLREKGVGRDSMAAIMAERSIEMIVGVMAILKSGGAYLPIDPDYPEERIKYMLEDSGARVLLIQNKLAARAAYGVELIDIDDEKLYSRDSESLGKVSQPKNLAYVIYTSGSTGNPKGVMVEHRNVVRLVKNTNYVSFRENDRILQTGALVFDASTFEIWGALLNGLELYLVDKDVIISSSRLEEEINKNDISILWLTSSLFNQLSQEKPEMFMKLRYLLVGGDVLSPKHINKVRKACKDIKIINGYGPTENTTFSVCYEIEKDYEVNIPIGKPIANSTAYIVDKDSKLQPIGVYGELWVGGDGVARGYLNRPELTAEKFIESPFKPGEMVYKTGDLARWLPDGNIDFLGRIDHQVKIRGFRIELGEIESRLMEIEGIKETVVLVIEENGNKQLCAYLVSEREYSIGDLREELKKKLPDYMIPSYFIPLDKMPLNKNGKIDRKALPKPEGEIETGAVYEAARNEMEEKLVAIWQEVLELNKIGINDNFFELGGHSLRATILQAKVFKEFNMEIPLGEIFKLGTIKGLSEYIASNTGSIYEEIEKVEESQYYEASPAQKRMYMLQALDQTGTAYNIPGAMIIEGKLETKKVEDTFKKLIERHEALRTSFEAHEELIIQRVHKPEDIEFDVKNIVVKDEAEAEEKVNSFIKAFDLGKAPLLRVGLITLEQERHILLFDMHHIVSDGTSMAILTKEFSELYAGKELTPLRIQYKDYSAWQNKMMQREEFKKQEEYWLNQFSGEIPVLSIPTDYARQAEQSFEGESIRFGLDKEQTRNLRQIAKDTGSTMYMVLLAGVNILLSKYSGQEDIIIGSDIAGRPHTDLENVMGMFVNTLALRNYPKGNKSFEEFLKEVKENALKAYENQDYQFEVLVDKLNLRRDISRNPLFDVMFAMANMKQEDILIKDLTFKDYEQKNNTVQFDITFIASEVGEEISISLFYCTKLFKRETMEIMSEHFKKLIKVAAEDRKTKISDIDMLLDKEKHKLLYDFNDTYANFPTDKTLHELFREQVEKTPHNVAAVFENQKVTYKELDEKSNQIAHALREKGAGRESLVGIFFERSIDMLASILGVFKAGGGYIPIDANYPISRVKTILADSRTRYLLTKSSTIKDKTEFYSEMASGTELAHIVCLDVNSHVETDDKLFKTLKLAQCLTESNDFELNEGLHLYYENKEMPYEEYMTKACRLGEFLKNCELDAAGGVGIIVGNPIHKIIAITALRMANLPLVVIDSKSGTDDKTKIIEKSAVRIIISDCDYLDEIDQMLWSIEQLNSYIILDNYNIHGSTKEDGFKTLWNIVADETSEQINDYGWQNSYDGTQFTIEEMNEYIDNFNVKLKPYLNENSRVFDIGCGHGLALFEIAPKVKEYLATDLSEVIVEKNRKRAAREGLKNVRLETAAASEISTLGAKGYDAVVCCSVIHYFPNTLYLEEIIKGAIDILGDEGIIYLDDLMDLHKKQELMDSVSEFKSKNPSARSKVEWNNDLFVNKDFFQLLQNGHPEIVEVEVSKKLGKIENELTRFRYDVILKINKKSGNGNEKRKTGKSRYTPKDIIGYEDQASGDLNCTNKLKAENEGIKNTITNFASVCDFNYINKSPVENVTFINEASDISYVIYTSGSTGKPKGAMVEHRGMVNHIYAKIKALNLSESSVIVQNASQCFDISVWQFLAALACGGRTVIYPHDVVMNPKELVGRVIKDGVTILEVVPSFLEVMLDHLEKSKEKLEMLDYILVTGEELKARLVKRWFNIYQGIRMVNAYGPTEASDDITHYIMSGYSDETSIPIGKPIENFKIYIVDEHMKLCPIGVKGEIVVSGIGVGRGYLNDEEKTKKAFMEDPFADEKSVRLYKTGDLGRWLPDGNIEFFGRKDYQVKIRGFRIELGEIESRLLEREDIKSAVVIDAEDDNGNKYLCAYVAADETLDILKVKEELKNTLPDYMMPSYFIQLESLPITQNGKVDRKALPKPGSSINTGVEYEAPRNPIEEKLAEIWSSILGVEKIGINSDFFELGGHSLKATVLVSRIHKELNIEIQLKDIFDMPTIKGISEYIENREKSIYEEILPVEEKEYYEASSAQKRMYAIQRLDLQSTAYNMPGVMEVDGKLSRERLENAFNKLIQRHEALRTAFTTSDSKIVQKINNAVDFKIEYIEKEDRDIDAIIKSFARTFDLSKAPLLRVGLVSLEKEKHILMFDMHHIISDGVSMEILVNDFVALYEGKELEALKIQYKEFSEWQNKLLESKEMRKQEGYWLDIFKGEIPVLKMPTDYARPEVQSFEGDSIDFNLDKELTKELNKLAKDTGSTMYMVLLSGVYVLLSKYSGQEDIIIGSPIAGRPHADLEKVIGMFVNTLAMRNYPAGNKSYAQFLREVRESALRAYGNQDYQFNHLVDKLNLVRDISRNPLFDVAFAMQNIDQSAIEIKDLTFKEYKHDYKISKMDIALLASEAGDEILINLQYSTRLFKKETMEKFIEHYKEILNQIVKNADTRLEGINISYNVSFVNKIKLDDDFDF